MTARMLMMSPLLLLVAAGCGTEWKGADNDGDGKSAADGDCWDALEGPVAGISGADIYPGATDAWYDGVDANCAGDDDFDADLDGFVPEQHVGRTTFGVAGSGALPGGDCLDAPDEGFADAVGAAGGEDPIAAFRAVAGFDQPLPSAVFPGAEDALYDDVDADCAGEDADGNGAVDDFDADLDGFASAVMARRDGTLGDDCAEGAPGEDPDVNRAGLPLEDIFPGATDSPYDGTDADCSGVDVNDDGVLDDCDLDLDGGAFDDADDGDEDGCVARDCDDTDSTAVPDPDVAEVFYDGVDNNCLLTLEDGRPDNDGDADRDGFWAVDYRDRVPSPDATVGPLPAVYDDCWDDPAALPAGWVEQPVTVFDPTGDWETSSTLAYDEAVTAAATFPGALDRPYDTIDQDCAGDDANSDGVLDDLDWDGDGYASLYQSGGDSFGDDCLDCAAACEGASGALGEICEVVCDNDAYLGLADEDNLTNRGLLDSAEVNPAAAETWGDGTDADCDRSSDFDQDKDFYAGRDYGDGEPWAFEEERVYYYSDGATLSGGNDCNDEVLAIRPGALDTWYDGIDQNCGDNDDFDADADGYVPTTYVGRTTAHGAGTPSFGGGLPGDDCNDQDTAFNPGRADTWYDGLDSDCADNDDYDRDVDSYVQTIHGGLRTNQGAGTTPYGGALPTDDCNDTLSSVNPGRADTWYDGVDTNCSDNDDYDADADGYVPTAYVGRTTSFGSGVATTFGGALPGDDCNDTLASVRPGLADTWYDGVDTDCADNDDYDQDADGHVRVVDATRTTSYGAGVSTTFGGALPANDCDDTNAGVYGGATTDVWYDGVDTDCAGNDDYDVDADGYASLARAGSYGPTTYVPGSGALPATDCNDTVSTVNPGRADTWYDGVDSNCGNNDDYDRDADGYVQTIHGGLSTNQGAGSTSFGGALPTDDCNDTLSTIRPGLTDTWYDGIDTNCSDNDDYDRDADAHVRAADSGRVTSYGAGSSLASFGGALPADDCDDGAPTVYGGATDTWYDGVDSDCGGNDDYDRDGDSYARVGAYGATLYVTGSGVLPTTDCNDGVSTVNPGRTDTWYDGVDSNCGGNDDYDRDGDGYVQTIHASLSTNQGTGSTSFGGALPTDDCNDTLSTIRPGLTDAWYDGVDTNCSDNDDYDSDADGYVQTVHVGRVTSYGTGSALASFGGALPGDDCNDTLNTIRPGLTDAWYDGVDTNCSDNDDYDADGDGYVQTIHGGRQTGYGAGSSLSAFGGALPTDDCNDTLSTIRPGVTDTWYDGVDTNCSDNDDYDQDNDGYVRTADVGRVTSYGAGSALPSFGGARPGNDCNDTAAAISPAATEVCDGGVDNDCDSLADDADPSRDSSTGTLFYRDADSDTYGNPSLTARTCVVGTGYVSNSLDCDDSAAAVKPGATEVCDDIDNDCDALIDDADSGLSLASATTWYRDADSDTYGTAATTARTCDAPSGYVASATDCNDGSAAINPGATEVCDGGVDNNCNSAADDADGTLDLTTRVTFYQDLDTDTYGNVAVSSLACAAPTGFVSDATDCDDANININPGEDEVCDPADVDEDCSLTADDADPGVVGTFTTFYRDADSDSYGNPAVTDDRCDAGGGYVSNDDDCDDGAAAVKPGATEVCDTVDNDCDTLIDDADPGVSGPPVTYYRDVDGDGQGVSSPTTTAVCAAPAGYATTSTDCDDGDNTVYLGAPEICDGQDNDCDSLTDDADTLASGEGTLTYVDDDLDDYGDETDLSPVRYCVVPSDRATNNTDCDDSDADINPGEAEIEDAIDQDCDDYYDEGFIGVDSVIITEIMYRPVNGAAGAGQSNREWFELHNPGSVDVVIDKAWRVRDGTGTFTITTGTQFVVPAGGYAMVARSADSALNAALPLTLGRYVVVGAALVLNDTGEALTVDYDDPTTPTVAYSAIDTVTYGTSAPWPASAVGRSVQLAYTAGAYPADNTDGANWCLVAASSTYSFGTPSVAQYGTPNGANVACPTP